MRLKLKRQRLYLVFILLLTSLAYVNTINNEFIWDDYSFILGWNEIKSLDNVPSLIGGSLPLGHEGVYRPLRSIFYVFSYMLWGENSQGYHFQAILIHLVCTFLVYFIILEIAQKRIVAFMASLLFGLHPIHTSAIAFITSSFDQIGIAFYLASFYLFICSFRSRFDKNSYLLSIVFATLAFFTYELALTLPIVIVLYELYFGKIKRSNIKEKVKGWIPYFISVLVFVFIRFFIIKIGERAGYLGGSFYFTMLSMFKAAVREIQLVVFPFNMNVHHLISKGILAFGNKEINEVAILSQSIFDIRIIMSIIILLSLLFLAFFLYKKQKIISFCIFWFFITLLPVSNIFISIQTLLDEDFLYLPSFGFCFLLSFVIYSLYVSEAIKKYRKIIFSVFAIIILSYFMMTVFRNSDWKDGLSLWGKTIKQNPESFMAFNNLGMAYEDIDNQDLALQNYKRAIEINPGLASTYYNIGRVYQEQKLFNLSFTYYQNALSLDPGLTRVYNGLGTVYFALGDINHSLISYHQAISMDTSFADAYNNLGNLYKTIGQPNFAIDFYLKAILIEDRNAKYHSNLGAAYYDAGKISLAIMEYDKSISLDPYLASAYYNLGYLYQMEGMYSLASDNYNKVLQLMPDFLLAKQRLAEIDKIN